MGRVDTVHSTNRQTMGKMNIVEVNIDAIPHAVAQGRDQYGQINSIDLRYVPGDLHRLPNVGETWWCDRRFGSWALVAQVLSDVTPLQQLRTWDPNPQVSGGTGAIVPVDNPDNHANFDIDGRRCWISYSQVFQFSGLLTGIILTLPVLAAHARVVFRGDIQNSPGRAVTGGSTATVTLTRNDGSAINTGTWHASVTGDYEWQWGATLP